MAVNHVDGTTFAGAIVCPTFAVILGGGAAGWIAVPCVIAALPVSFVVLLGTRSLSYVVLGGVVRLAKGPHSRSREIAAWPLAVVYLALPLVGVATAVFSTSLAVLSLAKFASQLGGWSAFALLGVADLVSIAFLVMVCRQWARRIASQTTRRAAVPG